MDFSRLLFTSLLLFSLSTTQGLSQNSTCKVKQSSLADVKELYGLRLGMTVAEVKQVVSILALPRADEFGLAKTSFTPGLAATLDKSAFPGVRTVSLEFLDGRVSSIWIGYDNRFKWQSTDDALDGLSAELQLPGEWQTKGREKVMVCEDFIIGVSIIANSPSIRIMDETAHSTWLARRDAKEEAKP
jgi:hypothetical protein